ncbi:MAG: response regulator [Nitrospirales bacterium]|nr:response regulator [Nitrospira sp.]MDR4502431.1 response regulator [Nitrospirales bacterium]
MDGTTSSTASSQPSILIVEDEEGPRESIKMVLSPYFNLITVDSAEVALQVLKRQAIDLVTLDLKLPGQQGIDLLQKIRQEGKELDVIIITGYGTLQSAMEAIRQGVAAYILKPFNVAELLAVVDQTFERRRRMTSLQGALEAFGNLWSGGSSLTTAVENIKTLLEAKSPELARHCDRVNFYSSLLAEHLQVSVEEKEYIQVGAYIHDIGKFGIHNRLISGDLPQSEQDHEVIKCHPVIGEKMIQALPFPKPISDIVHSHHERWDGTGYPDELTGEAIPYLARIVGLANIFDHLVVGQNNRGPLAVPEAREHIRREAGKSIDPTLANLFAKVVW